MDYEAILLKSFTNGPLNHQERQILQETPIPLSQLITLIKPILTESGYFPAAFRPWVPGQPVCEGGFLEKILDTKYRWHCQRHHPLDPYQLAERICKDFRTADKAIRYYLSKTHVPLKIIWHR